MRAGNSAPHTPTLLNPVQLPALPCAVGEPPPVRDAPMGLSHSPLGKTLSHGAQWTPGTLQQSAAKGNNAHPTLQSHCRAVIFPTLSPRRRHPAYEGFHFSGIHNLKSTNNCMRTAPCALTLTIEKPVFMKRSNWKSGERRRKERLMLYLHYDY